MKNIWQSIVTPPYRLLPFAIWSYVVLCVVILHEGGVFTGHLFGFDDQVRMTQVLNWVNGAGWYDRTIMRANPPEGFTTIWSRIVDIPIALIVIIAQQFVSQKVAAIIAAVIIPLTELAILFIAAPYFARPLLGKRKARLIVLFLIFTSILNVTYFSASGFFVGQVSHHPWYVILNLTLFGAAARLAMGSASLSPILMMGGSIALLTAVGIEGYPMIAGAAGLLAVAAWWWNRPALAARAATALLCGAVGSFLLLPMHRPPEIFFTVSFAEPSILGVILVAAAGLALKTQHLILKRWGNDRAISGVMLCLVAALIGGGLIWAFPDMLNGGAAGLSPSERKLALHEHHEARPVHEVSRTVVEFIGWATPPLIGLIAGVVALIRAKGQRRRTIAFCFLGFAAIGSGMAEIYSRYYHHAMTTCCAWLVWVWEQSKKRFPQNTWYALKLLGVFIILGPLWLLFLPAVANNQRFASEVLLFPADLQASADPCDSLPIADWIDSHYPKETLLDVPYWQSAQFLYQTDVRIDFLANYPSHDKFIENYNFFGTKNMEEARQIAARHGLDLVIACQSPFLYHSALSDQDQILVARMQANHVPKWMKLVNVDIRTNYLLYQVDKVLVQQPEQP